MPFRDLREFIGCIEEKGDLLRLKKPVGVKFEIAAYIRKSSDHRGPAIFFENVKGFNIPIVGGIFATRERGFLALESTPETYVNKFLSALERLIPPRLMATGPCKDVIHRGQDVDLTALPVPTFSEKDLGVEETASRSDRRPFSCGGHRGLHRGDCYEAGSGI